MGVSIHLSATKSTTTKKTVKDAVDHIERAGFDNGNKAAAIARFRILACVIPDIGI